MQRPCTKLYTVVLGPVLYTLTNYLRLCTLATLGFLVCIFFCVYILDLRNIEYIQENFPEGYNMLLTGHGLIQDIRDYQGGDMPLCALLLKCFEYAQDIDRIIPTILEELCTQVSDQDLGKTDRNRGLARLLADLMQNAFTFDALKASIPAIQNDLSYYRRTHARMAKSQDENIARNVIPQDVSNQMSLFYAYHNPMVKAVVDSASQFAKSSRTEALVLNSLSTLAAGSFNTLKQSKADSPESEQLCVFVLVTCCVLYDWISPEGISNPQSTIDIKAVADTVSGRKLVDTTTADNVLRSNCRTYR
ncbi:hypothetical protein BX661DRAFT_184147 [Kickxella alabastrina]|uniref:uncharacterized protein n=1 Tax=Kickxella alabastrina TaxID=61397 RepID=UPI002220D64F|nr:uncharacterized protein BX661DRAFT_184147 [Kickxella alabastrina]KAI7825778.1 hypothetical protein BX661DRAFT_184147 [Kickxella alabastrina]